MTIRIQSVEVESHDVSTRMPFKYGIATMTDLPHVFVRVVATFSGQASNGVSADHLPPKWFTKIPDKDPAAEVEEMRAVIANAGRLARSIQAETVFDFWKELYDQQAAWAKQENLPPLLAHFGTSLIERALIDAYCRHQQKPFSALLVSNAFGIRWSEIRPQLSGYEPKDLLPAQPLGSIIARHTVGLADYLTDSDIPAGERLGDGLPQSLEACIRFYGTFHFKLKVNGRGEQDVQRLKAIAALFDRLKLERYAFSVDGNEGFADVPSFRAFWETLLADPSMTPFLARLLFVEQPFHRDVALSDAIGDGFRNWPAAPLTIIDESDASLDSLPRALALGYRGTSHKNCKGVFKGVINRATINLLNRQAGADRYTMSGEDLSNIGPIANHQDLVVQAAIGIESVERNGHHYFKGLSVFDDQLQQRALNGFPDFYVKDPGGFARVNIRDGRLDLANLNRSPFGVDSHLPE